jgi:hypothetical protein
MTYLSNILSTYHSYWPRITAAASKPCQFLSDRLSETKMALPENNRRNVIINQSPFSIVWYIKSNSKLKAIQTLTTGVNKSLYDMGHINLNHRITDVYYNTTTELPLYESGDFFILQRSWHMFLCPSTISSVVIFDSFVSMKDLDWFEKQSYKIKNSDFSTKIDDDHMKSFLNGC